MSARPRSRVALGYRAGGEGTQCHSVPATLAGTRLARHSRRHRLFAGPVAWRSSSQKLTSHSSTESELYALDEATRELVYLKKLLQPPLGAWSHLSGLGWEMGQSAQSSGPAREGEAGRESGPREWGQAGATSRTSRTEWGSG